jgi:hypothetical protein
VEQSQRGGQAVSDHIPDLTKMIIDTPRKDHLIKCAPIGIRPIPAFDQAVELVDALERELNAANERTKRLEEAGDALEYASVILEGEEDPNGFVKLLIAQREWNKAKEAKP